ncbi:MAG: TIGR01777 family oxidoreductase [Ferruginibacter sp.]
MKTVLITGGTGLVGKALTNLLLAKGYRVIVLSRKLPVQISHPNLQYARWDVTKKEMDTAALQQADYIVHLAGAGVMDKKWTAAYKKEIISSRVDSGNLIAATLAATPNKVKAVIGASAIGWYQPGHAPHTEDEAPDSSFLGTTCKLWEESLQPVTRAGKRLVTLRIGIVLDKNGGALKEFMQPLKFGIAAVLGNGMQVISWIHLQDLCRLFVYAIEHENMQGVFNAVAPLPVSNKTLTLALAKKKRRFYIPVHVPSFLLKMLLGGRSTEILKSASVSSKKTEAAGFGYQFNTISAALDDLV